MPESELHCFLRLWDQGDVLATHQGRVLRYRDVADLVEKEPLGLLAERDQLRAERDTWKGRALGLQTERDQLAEKLAAARTGAPPAPHRVTIRTVRVLGPERGSEWHDEAMYDIDHTPQCHALPYGQDCWLDYQRNMAGTDDWPTEPGEYIATGEAVKSFNGEYTEYDFYIDFELVPAAPPEQPQ